MSIEKALADLTTAITANTAALTKMMSGAAAPGKAAAATPGKTAAGTKTPKVPTVEDIRNTFGGYMAAGKDKADKDQRKANVSAIVVHFGAERATEIKEENRAEAIAYIAQFEAGETPNFMNEEAAEEEGDSLL